ncbi:IclR family transcriptional regulator [Galbitalea soli]|uniref:IclR family transcriptional regulator n=1 Tax=Galbitalea soli TaxID=1268042 RepID=A0A7C9TTD3_9MICO|nr:IclR family transcriptional regulator [Galbitalea soli]NEM92264.1 IclR family transcriptional regulator [Galbitalea soli]NYJ31780.1 IclR family pca regulon transcriptional regulator [Galbitalea soli]
MAETAPATGKAGNQYRIESLAKGLSILRLFDENAVSLKLREICDRTGIPMPTAFRIVSTLEEGGFLDRTADGSFRPGVSVLTLGSAALRGSSLVQVSEKILADLAAATGETVNLGVLLGDQVLYLARLRNADLVTANVQVGSTLPAVYTSMGKLLLATLTPQEVSERIGPDAFSVHGGPNAVRNREELDARLAVIRQQGYAIQDQELALGLRSVSVPVYGNAPAAVAAINIAVSASRHTVESLRGPLLAQLRAAAADITVRLRAL